MSISTVLNKLSVTRSLRRHPNVSRDEIVAFQNKQLRRIIAHAYENVPYYRRLFDRNSIKPNDIQTTDDLPLIPITSKKDLQSLPAGELVARGVNPKHLIDHRTSGTTGEPFTIRRTWLEERLLSLIRLRIMRYFGQRPRDRVARLGLIHTTHPRGDNQLPMQILRTFGLYDYKRIDSRTSPEDIALTLRDFRPDIITGLPVVLSRVAEIINDQENLVIRPRFVRVNGATLTLRMRKQIMRAFSSLVFDYYACNEFRLIAWECKKTGELHTCDDSVIVEVLKNGRPATMGEQGEVVGTSLHSFAMPFIRYRLWDLITKGSETCQCGQPFSTVSAIWGRTVDYFPLPGGRLIHPYELHDILEDDERSWVRQYQFIQEREDMVILRVVPSRTPTPEELAQLNKAETGILGQDVEFHVMLVPEIKPEPSGKFRVDRSLVKSAYD